MGPVVADTHTIIWYFLDTGRLSQAAADAIRQAVTGGHKVCLSAISLVETVYLVEKGRLPEEAWDRLSAALSGEEPEVVVVSVSTEIARALRNVPRDLVPDMPDRIIAATAVHLGLPLISRDRQIRASEIPTIW